MPDYEDLMAFQRETEALAQIAGRLSWDQETMMPPGAAEQRGEEMAAIETVLHARRTDPRLGDWLEAATAPDPVAAAQIREIRRSYERATRIPARLAAEIARQTSLAQGIWAETRAKEDWHAFRPTLEEIVRLVREQGEALAEGGDPYAALLEDYEPGTSPAEIQEMFDALRPGLVALREQILGSETVPPILNETFPEAGQLALSERLAAVFGYDFDRGRIDKAVHPFSSGSGRDVRITTRTALRDPFNCFYSTIHEVGHAAYEQAVDPAYLLTPIGRGASMGVHESQSRIYENQLGRSEAFCAWLYSEMRGVFGEFGVSDAETFYAVVNRVAPGFIRTEADEVHYNLHIMMRFDLERALISGEVPVADLPEAWNARFEADFGRKVEKPSEGCLQDVHWSVGLFVYFPTYALGNIYAGCLFEALVQEKPDVMEALRHGDASGATGWLRDRLQRHGALHTPREVITLATGSAPGVKPLLNYLNAKFGAIYGF